MDDLKITNKNKRRSKNDTKDRNYKWGCGKNYLSYPALYTHIKQKHDGHEPTGTQSTQLKSGRGRGRPRKIFVADESNVLAYSLCFSCLTLLYSHPRQWFRRKQRTGSV